jgi:hypothetical protein
VPTAGSIAAGRDTTTLVNARPLVVLRFDRDQSATSSKRAEEQRSAQRIGLGARRVPLTYAERSKRHEANNGGEASG